MASSLSSGMVGQPCGATHPKTIPGHSNAPRAATVDQLRAIISRPGRQEVAPRSGRPVIPAITVAARATASAGSSSPRIALSNIR